ncbi:hypothetical protein ABZT02_20865 [Streptomyces sp. NPDC005402]|uniref:hypothetical protein n=1 Tax=Streptomyces sp. NPDC005402 TaxID=3155338 RepID=UPI0033BF1342
MEEHGSADPADGDGRDPARERPAPGTYMTPYRWETDPETGYRSRAVTLALLAIALVVALGAGGTVYAVLDEEGPGAAPPAPSVSP